MLCFYPLATLSFATFVSARPLPLYRRQNAVTDFGSCNATPDIIFALGLDGRKDPSFQAKNNDVYNHGSALGIGVITSFICQQLNDKCKAPQATLDACASGQAAAAKVTGGAAADSFNSAFGISTNFASGTSSGAETGKEVGKSTASTTSTASASEAVSTTLEATTTSAAATATDTISSTALATASASTCPTASTVTVTVDASATASTPCPTDPVTATTTTSAASSNEAVSTSTSSAAAPSATGPVSSLDFGSCTDPTIEFGPGRKAAEFSNKPINKQEFNQPSALNIDIVTRAVCDILASKCKAPQATLDACAKGKTAASAAAAKTGAQADAFNAALGITTNFATIPAAPGGGPGTEALATTPNFGTCTNPTMEFGVGFDGRTESSFQPANKADFDHGSALNPAIIATAICDTFVNSCNANKPAIDNCTAAKAAITGLTGQAVADAFNAAILKGAAQ
ncbi:hypothetical protein RHS01_05117 [Rhizoctonia solani]|uniref:Uncharacterized protein n=1 Tax=Rhizoctonia solani TaxID=456999 RepID=A0A8H7IDJ6_9AGAM|nr:hypothetical protein RHS01_05117 [Rhizoctonia solani]